MMSIPIDFIKQLDEQTQAWTVAAARGETGWVCSDCGASFFAGMPDVCAYGHQRCTEILQRDKLAARQQESKK